MNKKKTMESGKLVRILAVVLFVFAMVLNLQINPLGSAKVMADDSEEARRKGPSKVVDCVYTDGQIISISVGATTGGTINTGTRKAGKETICERTNQNTCRTIQCGPASSGTSGSTSPG